MYDKRSEPSASSDKKLGPTTLYDKRSESSASSDKKLGPPTFFDNRLEPSASSDKRLGPTTFYDKNLCYMKFADWSKTKDLYPNKKHVLLTFQKPFLIKIYRIFGLF